ncbi:MAG: hypothetical protein QOE92_921 [Chloroflexota bacterium]|jgi:hypothetical protein|nr:hypothetical protein [Chloroflexota bacterium]
MGALQTYFYLALIGITLLGLTLVLVGIAAVGLVRYLRSGEPLLTGALIGGAIAATLAFTLLTAGLAVYGFVNHGPA